MAPPHAGWPSAAIASGTASASGSEFWAGPPSPAPPSDAAGPSWCLRVDLTGLLRTCTNESRPPAPLHCRSSASRLLSSLASPERSSAMTTLRHASRFPPPDFRHTTGSARSRPLPQAPGSPDVATTDDDVTEFAGAAATAPSPTLTAPPALVRVVPGAVAARGPARASARRSDRGHVQPRQHEPSPLRASAVRLAHARNVRCGDVTLG